MSNNEKDFQTLNKINNSIKLESISFSSPSDSNTHKKIIAYSESNTKTNKEESTNTITMNLSTTYQTLSRNYQPNEEEDDLNLGKRLNNISNISENSLSDINSLNSNNIYSKIKPRLSLKDSRTKIKQLREKLYSLSEEERLKEQENFLAVPLNKMNDEKYKLLKMHNLKKKSLPEYKSCTKFEDYYKSFENSLDKRNEYFLLKQKKGVYSSTKDMILEINLKNKNKEKDFPLYRDQDIGIYEYWQVQLIESKIDEDNDSDEEQINLAKKVCNLDLMEGINYIQKNGIDEILNRHIKEENKEESQILNKSMSA
jgi:hypothetical protein